MENTKHKTFIGTAGWNIPAQHKIDFPEADFLKGGTHLQRYALGLNAVEINSSFYREHKFETYQKWASSVPEAFRFSVKLSRYFTQEKKLTEGGEKLRQVLGTVRGLAEKWAVLLVQLPPSLAFDESVARTFILQLKEHTQGVRIAWEPRHKTWGTPAALDFLDQHGICKVFADPEPCPVAESNLRRNPGLVYYRLHGTPEIYKSSYGDDFLRQKAAEINHWTSMCCEAWCIFDNTTFGFATQNALEIQRLRTA